MKITLSELKQIIRQEVKKTKRLNEMEQLELFNDKEENKNTLTREESELLEIINLEIERASGSGILIKGAEGITYSVLLFGHHENPVYKYVRENLQSDSYSKVDLYIENIINALVVKNKLYRKDNIISKYPLN